MLAPCLTHHRRVRPLPPAAPSSSLAHGMRQSARRGLPWHEAERKGGLFECVGRACSTTLFITSEMVPCARLRKREGAGGGTRGHDPSLSAPRCRPTLPSYRAGDFSPTHQLERRGTNCDALMRPRHDLAHDTSMSAEVAPLRAVCLRLEQRRCVRVSATGALMPRHARPGRPLSCVVCVAILSVHTFLLLHMLRAVDHLLIRTSCA
eukprot:scaffold191783_cov25-Tisochrysis_lutea.AAC.1